MSGILALEGLALIGLLFLSGFFSSSEVAFFSLNPLQVRRIEETHAAAARRVEWILSAPTRLLSTILIGNTLVNVAVSVVSFAIAERLVPGHSELVAIAGSLVLLLIFGEIGPKRIAVAHPARMASLYSPLLKVLIHLFTPMRYALEATTVFFSHLFQPLGRILTDEEFETVLEVGREEGALDDEERFMLKGVLRLEDMQASDVMTPRVDLLGIDLSDREADIEAVVEQAAVRQLLLYRESMDRVQGFLDVRAYLFDPERRMHRAWISPLYVPEACPLDQLLRQFLEKNRRAAVVVDEYGGTAGLVTRGDILEEISGDIDDERGAHELLFEKVGRWRWIMDGRVNLEFLGDQLSLDFGESGADRIAGWIAAQLERMPRAGDACSHDGWRFVVRQMRRHRITLVEAIYSGEEGSGI